MAEVHGIPGEWARVKGSALGLWRLYLALVMFGFSLAVFFLNTIIWGMVLLLISGGFVAWAWSQGLRRVERFYKGARGEERVSELLQGLPDSYHVFNDFVAGNHHVDHVVVGPAGIFSVETKCWRGQVTVEDGHILLDGQLPDRGPLAQALKEASAVKATLAAMGMTVAVTPVLAFALDNFSARLAEVSGAVVMNAAELRRAFETNRVVIPAVEVARLVALMEQ